MTPLEFSSKINAVTTPLKGSIPAIKTYQLSVKKQYEDLSLLEFYGQAMPHISSAIWKEKILSGNLTLGGKKVTPNHIVKAGEITQHTSKPQIEPAVNTNITLVAWHSDFIIINKPAPLPIHPGGRFDKNSLIEILKNAFPKENLKPVHRIDANTTGLVALARNTNAANEIALQFKNKTVKKEYLTLVEGIINQKKITLKEAISKELTASGGREISTDGRNANTTCYTLDWLLHQNQTLLLVIPHSGRTNQIRIHLANLKHPIVGDIGYKDKNYFKNNPLTYSNDSLYLHAWKLNFYYKNTKYNFTAPIPEKFNISNEKQVTNLLAIK